MNVEKMMKLKQEGRQRGSLLVLAGLVSALALVPDAWSALSITDGDFETTTANGTDIVSWFDNDTQLNSDGTNSTTAWWTTTAEANTANPFDDRAVILGDGNGTEGGATGVGGRWLYQEIGTFSGGTNYLSFDYAQPSDGSTSRSVGIQIDVYQGTFSEAADDVDIATNGLTLITSVSTPTIYDLNIHNFYEALDLSSANSSDPLWLRLSNPAVSGASWVCIDNVSVASSLSPFLFKDVSPAGTGTTNPVVLQAVFADLGSTYTDASLFLDGASIDIDDVSAGSETTIVTSVSVVLDALSTHTGRVVAVAESGQSMTNEWTFTMAEALSFVSGSPSGAGASAQPTLSVVIADQVSELDADSVELYLDGAAVEVDYIDADTPEMGSTTISGNWTEMLDAATTHTGMVIYAGLNPTAGPFTNTWIFSTEGDPGYGIYIDGTNAPSTDAYDVYQFACSTNDAGNVGSGDDAAAYVAHDRGAQGQLFTTGSESSYQLTSVWVKHVGGYETWSQLDAGDTHMIRITDPAAVGTDDFVIYSETLSVITNKTLIASAGMPLSNGSGLWIEYKLLEPVTLSGSTQYGFDLSTGGNDSTTEFFELAGLAASEYAGGDAYSCGSEGLGGQ